MTKHSAHTSDILYRFGQRTDTPKCSVELIRAAYPNPRNPTNHKTDLVAHYCVGGALNRWLGYKEGFPGHERLWTRLIRANPQLPKAQAKALAFAIVSANDKYDFEIAWTILEEALTHGQP